MFSLLKHSCVQMAVYKVYSHCVKFKYKTTICSKATVFSFIVTILTTIFPLLIAYRSHGFWIKSATYQEQPNIHFKHEYLLIVETDRIDSPVLCSTFRAFSKITNGINRCPMVKSREEDINQDGKFDELNIEIQVQLQQTDIALSVKLFLLFDYKLYKMSVFHMESLGVVQHSSSLPGARLDIVADLRLVQKQLLYSRGRDFRFNTSVFDLTRLVPDAFNLQTLFKEYARRNVTTRLSNVYPLWTAGRAPDMPFIVSAVVHYPEETILYRPGFWQVIKWAWVQYLSVFIIFVFIFRLVKEYVFSNQLVLPSKLSHGRNCFDVKNVKHHVLPPTWVIR